ncbi:Twin-arginine translocation pathway signal (plasmid) [Ketogulonicigenium robustum]|uniref:Twin-arginine translocation pathway signal n=2 Tax=Ketogulonicigenium robustum TaxID=92947 RepID=A0A1W6P392_9RHOB|nr:tripartite tricarboxylate transporter substrate binding protein [Ketogulonicigenium robustum]ARO15883.1 Twin-arginine translocation pathway signal [Ketogulonicigenium robustum]
MRFHTTVALCAAIAAPSLSFAQDYPSRPIQMVVPWGAGGATDAVARIMASILQEDLGVPVNVVNRTGGSGVVGHSAISNAAPDGYTIGLATVEVSMMHWQGLTDMTYEDFDVLGLVNYDPAGIMVRADSGFSSPGELIDAIRAQPAGSFKASGSGQGSIWHLALAGWLADQGIDPNHVTWVPSQGTAPALTDLMAGGVDMVTSQLAEADAMIRANRIHPLGTMGAERLPTFPDTPTINEDGTGTWTVGAWRGIFAPAGLPDDVRARLTDAVAAAAASPAYTDFMNSRGFGVLWVPADEAVSFIAESDASFGEVMAAAGLRGQ